MRNRSSILEIDPQRETVAIDVERDVDVLRVQIGRVDHENARLCRLPGSGRTASCIARSPSRWFPRALRIPSSSVHLMPLSPMTTWETSSGSIRKVAETLAHAVGAAVAGFPRLRLLVTEALLQNPNPRPI